ncbi:ATP-binding protein [Carboxylicivirga marina]|uniref:histidine kinase n=1 Tax=Carboxylicivirga marina TaxID=2800988 RepID=A0ABS1HFQ1_9BACT|nr:ATP-binding protein [Carboxylicivirga marina]MBK3516019.1 PAS domain S-box protein [Carboxylicivirga marina]
MTIDKPTILVYDDSKLELLEIKSHIIEAGYIPLIANNEDEFNRYLYHYKVSLIILDVVLQATNGFEICRRLKLDAKTKEIPLIFLTALSNQSEIMQGLQLGAEEFIIKPINKDIFKLRLSRILKRYKELDEYNALFQEMNSCSFVLEPLYDMKGILVDAIISTANPSFLLHTNKELEEVLSTSFKDYPELEGVVGLEALTNLLQTREAINAEYYNKTLNRWYKLKAYLISFSKIVLILADITDDKRYELEQTLIGSISKSLISNNDFETKIKNALELLGNYLEVSRVYIYEDISSGSFFNNTYEWCAIDVQPYRDYLQHVDYHIIPSWKELIEQRGEIITTNISELPGDIKALFEPQGVKAVYACSLRIGNEQLGYLGVNNTDERFHWDSSTLKLIRTVSNIISTAIQREHASQQLEASKRQLDLIFENSPVTQVLLNDQLQVLRVNHSKVFDYRIGFEKDSFLPFGEVFKCINHTKEKECGESKFCSNCTIRTTIIKNLDLGQGENKVEGLMRVNTSNGVRAVSVLVSTAVIKHKNGENVLVSIDDITERKRAENLIKSNEKRLKQIFSVAQVGICLAKQGEFVFVNRYLADLLGYTDEEVLRMPTSGLFCSIEDYNTVREKAYSQLEVRKHASVEVTLKAKNGELIYAILMAAFYNNKDESEGLISVITNITPRKLAEEALLQNQKSLRKANNDKDTFISILGHDLNNAIGGSVQIVNLLNKVECSEEERQMFIKQIFDNTLSAHGLLTNLVIWGKNTSGQIGFKPENVKVQDLYVASSQIYQLQLNQKQLSFTFADEQNAFVHGDPFMLDAIIRNLVNNAIKFTPEGGQISLGVKQENDSIILSLTDTGIGIVKEKAQCLFSDEYMQSGIGTDGEQGTGIGLKIIKGFVDRHEGQIWIDSEPGKGTCVSVALPQE